MSGLLPLFSLPASAWYPNAISPEFRCYFSVNSHWSITGANRSKLRSVPGRTHSKSRPREESYNALLMKFWSTCKIIVLL